MTNKMSNNLLLTHMPYKKEIQKGVLQVEIKRHKTVIQIYTHTETKVSKGK